MKKLLFPVLTLLTLIGLLLFSEGIAAQFSKNLEAVAKIYLRYGLQTAIWLSVSTRYKSLDRGSIVGSFIETLAL